MVTREEIQHLRTRGISAPRIMEKLDALCDLAEAAIGAEHALLETVEFGEIMSNAAAERIRSLLSHLPSAGLPPQEDAP